MPIKPVSDCVCIVYITGVCCTRRMKGGLPGWPSGELRCLLLKSGLPGWPSGELRCLLLKSGLPGWPSG